MFVRAYRDGSFAGLRIQPRGDASGRFAYPIYTIYHINMIPEVRAILLSFLIMSLKSCPTMAEFDYSNTILIVKPVGPDAIASLRSDHNTNRLMSFHFEDGVSSVSGYDDSRSRECTPCVSRPPELQLHLQFDPEPKDATQGFVLENFQKPPPEVEDHGDSITDPDYWRSKKKLYSAQLDVEFERTKLESVKRSADLRARDLATFSAGKALLEAEDHGTLRRTLNIDGTRRSIMRLNTISFRKSFGSDGNVYI